MEDRVNLLAPLLPLIALPNVRHLRDQLALGKDLTVSGSHKSVFLKYPPLAAAMNIEDYFDFQRPANIRLKGMRIGIETILYDYIYKTRTVEELLGTSVVGDRALNC